MTGYNCTVHIAEELRRAAYVAPAAILIVAVGTASAGWFLNIALILYCGPFANLPGPSGSAFLAIMVLRLGLRVSLALWVFVCMTAFFVAQTGVQSVSRAIYAFSRDCGLPDGRFFGHINVSTQTPLRAVWLTVLVSALPGLLDLANPVAANAAFATTAMALDLSYVILILLRRIFHSHPEVQFKPGPYYMGHGWIGVFANVWCALWTCFVCVVFSLPTQLPITATNMNYASLIIYCRGDYAPGGLVSVGRASTLPWPCFQLTLWREGRNMMFLRKPLSSHSLTYQSILVFLDQRRAARYVFHTGCSSFPLPVLDCHYVRILCTYHDGPTKARMRNHITRYIQVGLHHIEQATQLVPP